jgi:monoamine oxidase
VVHDFHAMSVRRKTEEPYAHPEPWAEAHHYAMAEHWDGRVFLCGAETDDRHPGYIEGAVRAGERAGLALLKSLSSVA